MIIRHLPPDLQSLYRRELDAIIATNGVSNSEGESEQTAGEDLSPPQDSGESQALDPMLTKLATLDPMHLVFTVFPLVYARPPTSDELTALISLLDTENGLDELVEAIDQNLSETAARDGAAAVINTMALESLGLTLDTVTLQSYVSLQSNEADSWGDFVVKIVDEFSTSEVWNTRTQAYNYFFDRLTESGKAGLFDTVSLAAVVGDTVETIQAASDLGVAKSRLDGFIDRLSADGLTGTVVDGLISGATVFIDADGDGIQDPSEFSTETNSTGVFAIPSDVELGTVIASGGIDQMTNRPFEGSMTAPSGSALVNPLTTLVQATKSATGARTTADAERLVKSSLGITPSIDVMEFNPFSVFEAGDASPDMIDTAMDVQKIAVQVSNVIAILANAQSESESLSAGMNVARGLGRVISESSGSTLDLADQSTITRVAASSGTMFDNVNASDMDAISSSISRGNQSIGETQNLESLSSVAVKTQSDLVAAVRTGRETGNLTEALDRVDDELVVEPPPRDPQAGENPSANPGTSNPSANSGNSNPPANSGNSNLPANSGNSNLPPTSGTDGSALVIMTSELGGTSSNPAALDVADRPVLLIVDPRVESFTQVSGFGLDDLVQFKDLLPDDVAIGSRGGTVTLVTNQNQIINEIILTDAVGSQAIVFDMASFQGQVDGQLSFPRLETQQNISLDSLDSSTNSPRTLDVSAVAAQLVDDPAIASNTEITNFSSDDRLGLIDMATWSVDSQGTNLMLSKNNSSVVSEIEMQDVLPAGSLVTDFSGLQRLTDLNIEPLTESDQILTLGSDGGTLRNPQTLDLGGSSYTVEALPGSDGAMELQNFGADDVIQLADLPLWSVASIGNNVVLSRANGATISEIIIQDSIDTGSLITDFSDLQRLTDLNIESLTESDRILSLGSDGGTVANPQTLDLGGSSYTVEAPIGSDGAMELQNFGADDVIQLADLPLWSVSSTEADVILTRTNASGASEIRIVDGNPEGSILTSLGSAAETLEGTLFVNPSLNPIRLDDLGGSPNQAIQIDLSLGNYRLEDLASQSNNVAILNAGLDDVFALEDITAWVVESYADDIVFTNNSNGVISEITLVGVHDGETMVTSIDQLPNISGLG